MCRPRPSAQTIRNGPECGLENAMPAQTQSSLWLRLQSLWRDRWNPHNWDSALQGQVGRRLKNRPKTAAASSTIGPLASLTHALLGNRVYVYPGARIGQDGFGFAITAQGFLTVPQLGRVILEDDVEVGANSTVDRGAALKRLVPDGIAEYIQKERLYRKAVASG